MNRQETLDLLEEEKKELEEKVNDSDRSVRELNKRKLKLVEELIKSYSQSSFEAPSSDEVDQIFNKVYGFDKQKEEVKSLLLLEKGYKAENIENPKSGKVLCFVGPPGVGKTFFAEQFAKALGRKFHRINL